MPIDLQTIDTGAARLRVAIAGEGPLIVLVHGFPESWYSWRHQIPVLADAGFRVAAPDVRGYGGSDRPHPIDAYAIKELSGDIAGLIAALGARQAVVIGHDWGAPIAYTAALLHPARVRAVAGLSVPYLGRGPVPSVELFRRIYQDRFFYQLYFQEPGVAEAELEADVRTSTQVLLLEQRRSAKGKRPDCKSGRTRIARSPGRSRAVSNLADRCRSRLLCEPVPR